MILMYPGVISLRKNNTYMINTDNIPREEPDFTNDQLTDMVLHKDDEPVVRNGEIINEPEDVEEQAVVADDADVFPLDGDSSSCWFPIHFSYNGVDHTADVQKKKAPLAEEYHVSDVTPAIDHLPEPFIVAEHFSNGKYDFPVNEDYYPLVFGDKVVAAIQQGNNQTKNEE
jgi:hypothetical protein